MIIGLATSAFSHSFFVTAEIVLGSVDTGAVKGLVSTGGIGTDGGGAGVVGCGANPYDSSVTGGILSSLDYADRPCVKLATHRTKASAGKSDILSAP
jgi:hypothetical protein